MYIVNNNGNINLKRKSNKCEKFMKIFSFLVLVMSLASFKGEGQASNGNNCGEIVEAMSNKLNNSYKTSEEEFLNEFKNVPITIDETIKDTLKGDFLWKLL